MSSFSDVDSSRYASLPSFHLLLFDVKLTPTPPLPTSQDEERLEQSLPVVTALAFHIQAQYNSLLALLEVLDEPDLSEDDRVDGEQNVIEKEFIIKEMMKLAVELDYSDETGRRKMRGLARESSSLPFLTVPRRSSLSPPRSLVLTTFLNFPQVK